MALTRAPVEPGGWSPFAGFSPLERPADGPIVLGADLSPTSLVGAYRAGLFPVPPDNIDPGTDEGARIAAGLIANRPPTLPTPTGETAPDHPMHWWSPDPRCVLWPAEIHITRRLRERMRASRWTTTVDTCFDEVVRGCRREGPLDWITPGLIAAYSALHLLGWAHSVEVWSDDDLAGGLFGIGVSGVFAIESMFYRESNASKVAMIDGVRRFTDVGGTLIDLQFATDHFGSMGAREIPRSEYLAVLAAGPAAPPRLIADRLAVSRLARVPGQ